MTVPYYALKDKKVHKYLSLVTCENDQAMVRQCSILLRDERSIYAQCCEDFSLWKIGYFDQDSGKFATLDEPELIAQLDELYHILHSVGGDK